MHYIIQQNHIKSSMLLRNAVNNYRNKKKLNLNHYYFI